MGTGLFTFECGDMMSRDQKEVCANCRWWDGNCPYGEGSGYCRVHAPALSNTPSFLSNWPLTRGDNWCGEFTSRPGDLEFARGELEKIGCQADRALSARESDTHPKGEDLQSKAEFMSSTVDEVHSPNTPSFQSIGDLASRVLAQTKAKMEPNP